MEMIIPRKRIGLKANVTSVAENWRRACSVLARMLVATGFRGKAQIGSDSALLVEEKLSLGPKKMLYLVRCREKEFLVAAGHEAIVSVVEVSEAKANPAASSTKASLARMQKRERLS